MTLAKHIAFSQSLAGKVDINLSQSSANTFTFGELNYFIDGLANSMGNLPLGYAPIKGSPLLRSLISDLHNEVNRHQSSITLDNVLTFCGAQDAIATCYQQVLEAGDEVVIITPCYPQLLLTAQQLGCKVVEVSASANHDWQVSIEQIRNAINDKTKLVVINSPHNPTGSVLSVELMGQIVALCRDYDCYLLSDDVAQLSNFKNLELGHSFLDYDKALIVSVMSKSFGLAGVRLGWVISKNTQLIDKLVEQKSLRTICCSALDEFVATKVLEQGERILTFNNQLLRRNYRLILDFIEENQAYLSWVAPQAGLMALVEVKHVQDIEQWCIELAEKTGLMAIPSSCFGLAGNYFRIGLGGSQLEKGLPKLTQFLRK